jgi:hypothetical protein
MIKQGEVAFLKTTGEAVSVLAFRDPSPKLGDKSLIATVRRPVAGQDGIQHIEDDFFIWELESIDEQRARFMSENAKLVEKYGPKAESLSPVDPNNGFSSN